MFRAWCTAEGREVLLTTRRIRSIAMGPDAVVIAFTCWCGHEGHTHDRRSRAEPAAAPGPSRASEPSRPSRPSTAA